MAEEQNNFNIELDEVTAEGTYCNLAIINHSNTEFVVDFVNIMPGVPKGKVKSRIVLTPVHAKRLLKALNDNVSRFEKANGEIQDFDANQNILTPSLNFGPKGNA